MQLHSDFEALKPSKQNLARLLNRDNPCDGAYARVVPYSDATVLKATSCDATNLLFESLITAGRRKSDMPDALPAVLRDHGVCVADRDGIRYRVWEVERLFTPQDEQLRTFARVAGRKQIGVFKPSYRTRTTFDGAATLSDLVRALEAEQSLLSPAPTWADCAKLAAAMSVRTEGALRDAFVFLQSFVLTHRVELDMLTQGNLLLDMFGKPVLSDPVNSPAQTLTPRFDPGQPCLVLTVPVELLPQFRVKTETRSTFPLAPAALDSLAQKCAEAEVPFAQVEWGSPEHSRLLRTKAVVVPLWDVPDAAKRLATDFYQSLLLSCS